ncbi:ribonucleoside triphosphate reductase [bacterium]|nr:ribonucleoside triphosphate reductase [bacterium]
MTIKHVEKRDGRFEKFDIFKIENALRRSFKETKEEQNIDIFKDISKQIEDRVDRLFPTVEDIQDVVEVILMENGYHQTAKAYIIYREKHEQIRKMKGSVNESLDIIDNYIDIKDWRIKENSNMSYSLQGLNNHISSGITANYWLTKIYSRRVANAHISGDFHIHDLGSLSSYCVGWDLGELMERGFGGVVGKVQSKPPKHFRSALGQIVNFMYTMQGEAAGAQAFANFDTLLSPYIRYDNLAYSEVKQAMQEFIFNLNVPTRTGFQTPFSNLTMDLTIPSSMRNRYVRIAGLERKEKYGDFQEEMDMINNAFAEVMVEGDAVHRIFTFPIPTYNITKYFDWDNKNLTKVWEMTAKYGIPYFANFVNSDMDPDDARSMCCRLRLDNREIEDHKKNSNLSANLFGNKAPEPKEHEQRRGGLFNANPLTGSIGVVTINLPRIAYLSPNKEAFMKRLAEKMEIAKESLEVKRKLIEKLTENNLYPYTRYWLKKIKDEKGEFWANHFSTIGLVGMNEAVLNFLKMPYYSIEGKQFAKEVLDFMLEKLKEFKKETGNLYNLEASPAESASYRLAKKDLQFFGDVMTAGSTDTPYYTNSVHLPVWETRDVFETLDHQDELQSTFTGGTVIHFFIGEEIHDIEPLKTLIKNIAQSYKLPYFSITPTFSICPVHGYTMGEHWICEKEHSEEELKIYGKTDDEGNVVMPMEVYSRVVGYYRPVQNWNKGKQKEFKQRIEYSFQKALKNLK